MELQKKVIDEIKNLIWYRNCGASRYNISIYKDRSSLNNPYKSFSFSYKTKYDDCLCFSCRDKALKEVHPKEKDFDGYDMNYRHNRINNGFYEIIAYIDDSDSD